MELYENKVLKLSGFKNEEMEVCWTTIEMNNKPFKIRTFYFGKEQRDKPTLLLTHGNMANIVGFFRLTKILSEKYRIVAFDNMNLGMNTRSTDTVQNETPETAEEWIRDWLTKAFAAFDIPEKFYMTAHSFGGYITMMVGSLFPERIESMFLMSPAGTNSYNAETYEPYGYVSM
jgi:pimeloyl-ACP methyl ester carboxylesterase